MMLIKRPGDIWLRIWLIVLWVGLQLANDFWFKYFFDTVLPIVEFIAFAIFAFVLVVALWHAFKRPNCTCWDDIESPNPEDKEIVQQEEARRFAASIPEDESHIAKWQQVINDGEWKPHDYGESYGHGGLNG